ncbi:MAG: ribose 5-phosphate isomerase B [Clostridiales bacterium]|nr:ribose 5-phosphate isomerase B [Clostridiales bacterium]
MKVSIASDHAGYDMRQLVIAHLIEKGFEVIDGGAVSATERYSYVDAGNKVAEDVLSGKADRGIAICGTGIGISMVCNKHKGIRAALCHNEYTARMCRQHNDANVLAFGARVTGPEIAYAMVDCFFAEEFAGGRHAERVNAMKATEEENFK